MPTFKDAELTVSTDVYFEVFCGTCGKSLDNVSNTYTGKYGFDLKLNVDVCPNCMAAKDDKIDELNEIIENLEIQLTNK